MVFTRPLRFVTEFVEAIDGDVRRVDPNGIGLSKAQRWWLSTCIMGVIITNSVCWARFSRAHLGRYTTAALCWVFVHAGIAWDALLRASVETILREHGVTEGTLVIDDSDKKRSKTTTQIWGVHKVNDHRLKAVA